MISNNAIRSNLSILDFSILRYEISVKSEKKQKRTDTGKLNICGHLVLEKGKPTTLNMKKNIEIVFF